MIFIFPIILCRFRHYHYLLISLWMSQQLCIISFCDYCMIITHNISNVLWLWTTISSFIAINSHTDFVLSLDFRSSRQANGSHKFRKLYTFSAIDLYLSIHKKKEKKNSIYFFNFLSLSISPPMTAADLWVRCCVHVCLYVNVCLYICTYTYINICFQLSPSH